MKKIRKGKKMLIITLLAIAVVIIATVVIVNIVNKNPGSPEIPDDVQQVIPLPETVYSDMQVKNVQMEYLKNNDQTVVSMVIHNTTENKVEDEHLIAMLIDSKENVLGQMQTWIQKLDVGEQYKLSVVLEGDLTATTHIKLVQK